MDEQGPAKRQRNFIARQACETCRLRKTRCDEDIPCSLCRELGTECIYGTKKATKNEVSLSMIFNILRRMEGKVEEIRNTDSHTCRTSNANLVPQKGAEPHLAPQNTATDYLSDEVASHVSPADAVLTPGSLSYQKSDRTRISFSAHETLGVVATSSYVPQTLFLNTNSRRSMSTAALELTRPSLNLGPMPSENDSLATLSLRTVRELSDAYFATFNRIYPIVDRDFYFAYTLNLATQDGFDSSIESCVVLAVMALGCLGKQAHEDGGFPNPTTTQNPEVRRLMEERIPGMSLLSESFKRIGFCMCDGSLHSCQYYLLCAHFYEQMARPLDEWNMINRACSAYMLLLKDDSTDVSEWQADMQSKLFWTCLLRESVISQELELTPSGLSKFEDETPLPRFVRYSLHRSRPEDPDESYYHYHFLAQLALRIILTRVRNELYFTNPSPSLAEELLLQLEQWCHNLPAMLQFSGNSTSSIPQTPSEAIVVALLRTRYTIACYHIGRPFLLKAIRTPTEVTENDISICSQTIPNALLWPLAEEVCRKLKTFMPVKYFACAQIFGQGLILAALDMSKDTRLRRLVPADYSQKCLDLITFMSEVAPDSPSISANIALLSDIYR